MELDFSSRAFRNRVSIDWALVATSTFAAALLLATMIRTAPDDTPGRSAIAGGLQVLTEDERLVSFEDFSFGAPGWDAVLPPSRQGELRNMLGPLDTGAIERNYGLPSEASRVEVAFDLRVLDGWSGEGLTVMVNGDTVIEDLAGRSDAPDVVVRRQADGDYAVWIAVENPGEALSLRLEATQGGAAWAVDNVSVVVSTAAS
ncbi:hypothetical protein P6F26_01415 [Roseibacterium sp. SDUM158017]|uniref:hypothetical protein n=1 Tax=Roseicyclus salinarum TaxID=3036773 RepID=UPI00241540F3|nr:hypothetical protein [Roseibacterium sp. SDUM158017]MDG4647091.1 hypothetical protein [Roseibacterium sp. SDUM158017]